MYGKIFVRDHSGQCPVLYLENIELAMEQSDWLILVIGPLNLLSRVIIPFIYSQVQKSDRINSDRQSGLYQLGSTRINSDRLESSRIMKNKTHKIK